MEARKVVDRHVIGGDCVELSRHQGVHLLGDLLLVLGVSGVRASISCHDFLYAAPPGHCGDASCWGWGRVGVAIPFFGHEVGPHRRPFL